MVHASHTPGHPKRSRARNKGSNWLLVKEEEGGEMGDGTFTASRESHTSPGRRSYRGGLAPLDNIAQEEEEEHMLFCPAPIINN